MAEKNSLSLSMTAANGAKMTKAVTDINPDADNAAITAFAQGLVELTTNTLVSTSKITKKDIPTTSYPVVIEVDSGSDEGLIKVDDTHYNINTATLIPAEDSMGMFFLDFYVNGVKLKSDTQMRLIPDNFPYVVQYGSQGAMNCTPAGQYSGADFTNIYGVTVIAYVAPNRDPSFYAGCKFDLVIPETTTLNGLNVDKTVIHFEMV